MNRLRETQLAEKGIHIALMFALVAERLSTYYEHGQWLTPAQGATLASDWLARSKRTLSAEDKKRLSSLSDDLARQMATTLSRQAGLFTAHEMMESLDPNYQSEIGESMMVQCEQMLAADENEAGPG
ncbi:MAG TPA: hypothetical protein VFW68_02350 [Rhodocyclaceae bacterium]|nr:hypothetical protein [Rhodocyclaceae bacterium]